jgi:hypothetical protein
MEAEYRLSCSALQQGYGTRTAQKKVPANGEAGTTQDRAKRRGNRCGVSHRNALHLAAITYIGYVYAGEASIGWEYDLNVTQLKRNVIDGERLQLCPVTRYGQKKSPLAWRASNYFLGGE